MAKLRSPRIYHPASLPVADGSHVEATMTRVASLLLIGGLDADCTASTRLLRCLLSCHVPHGGKRKGTYPLTGYPPCADQCGWSTVAKSAFVSTLGQCVSSVEPRGRRHQIKVASMFGRGIGLE
jgi:hypothetical protein